MFNDQLATHRDRLADLLSFAHQHIPYYQKAIPDNIAAVVSDIHGWQQLPILDKRQIQADWTRFLVDPAVVSAPDVQVLYTSGTTGAPLKVARPVHELRKLSNIGHMAPCLFASKGATWDWRAVCFLVVQVQIRALTGSIRRL